MRHLTILTVALALLAVAMPVQAAPSPQGEMLVICGFAGTLIGADSSAAATGSVEGIMNSLPADLRQVPSITINTTNDLLTFNPRRSFDLNGCILLPDSVVIPEFERRCAAKGEVLLEVTGQCGPK